MTLRSDPLEDQQLRASFVEEAHGYLRQINTSVELLGSGRLASAEDLGRAAHTLRGASASLGLHDLADAAASVELLGQGLAMQRLVWRGELAKELGTFVEVAEKFLERLAEGSEEGAASTEGESIRGLGPRSLEDLVLASSRLEELAGEGGEVDEIGELLKEEARDYLRQMNLTLQELSRDPARRRLLEDIRRPAHTLKGSAATAGFSEVSHLAHRFEDVLELESSRSGPLERDRVQLFLEISDRLEDLLKEPKDAKRSPQTERLLAWIEDASQGASSVSAEAEPRPVEDPEPEAAIPFPAPTEDGQSPAHPRGGAPTPDSDTEGTQAERLLRISAADLDDTLRVAGESLIHRASFEGYFASLREVEEELAAAMARLGRLNRRLQTEFEARALMELPALSSSQDGLSEFDSLEMDRYTELHLIGRELTEAVSDIGAVSGTLSHTVGELDGFHGRMGRLLGEVQDRLGRLRMVPFAGLQSRLFRTVRAAEKEAGVKADLFVEAAGVEIDKNVLDELMEPLLHVLRNAVDHGIEPPEERRGAGKSERGNIRVGASYKGAQIEVTIQDDGRGLDLEALKTDVVKRGILPAERVESMSDSEACQLALLPRVSTAEKVSELSGRGVGLEVLKAVIDRLRGSLGIESSAGQGVSLTLRLPMTLASLSGLFVTARDETFAIPQFAVQQILRVPEHAVERGDEGEVFQLGGERLPVVELGALLALPRGEETSWPRPGLVIDTGERKVLMVVDALRGSREVVVKSLGPLLSHLRGFMGATLTGEGAVILLLDPTVLAGAPEMAGPLVPEVAAEADDSFRVLVVDDSLTVRRILTRLIEARGWEASSARDGLEALEMIQGGLEPKAILLDIEMPRMDGYELTALLRANPQHASIPIMMLTSRAGQKHRDKAAVLGVDAYLVKPYDEETLIRTVREITS